MTFSEIKLVISVDILYKCHKKPVIAILDEYYSLAKIELAGVLEARIL
jgi:hypothetical protein